MSLSNKRDFMTKLLAVLIVNLLLLSAAIVAADSGNITDLKNVLEKDGFTVQEGKFGYVDIIGFYEAGLAPSCYGNNPSTPHWSSVKPTTQL
jgi:hypothetical protein